MSSLTDWINATPERRRDYEQERLTVDVAENLQGLLDKAPMKRAELARRMGTSRQSLHQMLSGEQNLTLRTIAIMAHELGCRASVKFEPYSAPETRSEVQAVCDRAAHLADVPTPSVMDRLVTVCSACETAACWQGSFMCDHAEGAGIKNLTVRDLHEKPRGENAEYWFKDGDGKIDKTLLEIYQRMTSQNRRTE